MTLRTDRTHYGVGDGASAWVRKGEEYYRIEVSDKFKNPDGSWRGGYTAEDLVITERPEDGGTVSDDDLLWMAMDAFLDAYGSDDD